MNVQTQYSTATTITATKSRLDGQSSSSYFFMDMPSLEKVDAGGYSTGFADDLLVQSTSAASAGYDDFASLFGYDPFDASSLSFSGTSPDPVVDAVSLGESSFSTESSYLQQSMVMPKEEPRIPSSRSSSTVSLPMRAAVTKDSSAPSCKRERNRLAAERCRQRKAQLIDSLQKECDELKAERERLLAENARLMQALGIFP